MQKGTTINIPNIAKEEHTLDGWYTSVNDGITFDERWSFTNNTVNNNITLYAKWEPVQYKITYVLNNGTIDSNPQSYTIESSNLTLNNPIRSGYTFEGWYDNDQFNGHPITQISNGRIGDLTLYAKYKSNIEILSNYFSENGTLSSNAYRININLNEYGNFNFYYNNSNSLEFYRTTYQGSMIVVTKIMGTYGNMSKLGGALQVQIGSDYIEVTFSGNYDNITNTFVIAYSTISHSDWSTNKASLETVVIPSVEMTMQVFGNLLENIGIPFE